jgi:hypothetical protein
MNVKQNKVISKFIGDLQEFEQFMRDLGDELSDKIDSHSESWQDGDKGQAAGEERDSVIEQADAAEAMSNELIELVGE